uniref:Large ribosomal subunit protein eL37 n=1 Tax=Suricata suricatta TaxID=37032 RepID=A0A673SN53_SURSU
IMKETSSFGKRYNKTHTLCHCCGSRAYRFQKLTCGKCGFPAKQKRKHNWSAKEQHLNPREQLLQYPVHLKDFND